MKVYNTANVIQPNNQPVVVHTCPNCNVRTRFESFGSDYALSNNESCGHRYCPSCKEYLFVGMVGGMLRYSYPPLRINFESTDVPAKIVKTFSEALGCHSHSHF